MTMEDIFKTMQDLIAEQFAIDADEISMDSSFVDDLGADSVDLVELVMAMEEEFDIGEIDEEDLAGLKIRVMTNEPLRAMFTNAGAVVTNVSFSELYQALQLGTCEAEENPFANIRDKKFYEVQSYMCVTMHSHTAEPLVMSKELFDSLSAEDQAMFQEAGLEASKWAYQHAKDTDAENREYLEGQMTVIDPDRELWKEFAAETNASYEANYTEAAALKI